MVDAASGEVTEYEEVILHAGPSFSAPVCIGARRAFAPITVGSAACVLFLGINFPRTAPTDRRALDAFSMSLIASGTSTETFLFSTTAGKAKQEINLLTIRS